MAFKLSSKLVAAAKGSRDAYLLFVDVVNRKENRIGFCLYINPKKNKEE